VWVEWIGYQKLGLWNVGRASLVATLCMDLPPLGVESLSSIFPIHGDFIEKLLASWPLVIGFKF